MTWRHPAVYLVVLGGVFGAHERHAAAKPVPRGHGESFVKDLDCGACHNAGGWKLSTAPSGQKGFDHARTGFPLTGVHEKTGCAQCHQPEKKTQRACVTCHQDAHAGRLGNSCEQCHNARRWSDTDSRNKHRMTRLPLTS